MKEIINAKTSFGHLSIVFILALFICVFLYMLGVPLIYWAIYGEGASFDKVSEMPIHIFIENWGALILILLLCTIAMYYNFKKLEIGRSKSYLITATVISVLYIFSNSITDIFTGL
ncbi:hypothetical protein [Pedobacter agri]|uniref:hypothetical protein n=1 Tax=Pedobacter agri TaxID=454586 RepID=UPI00292D49EC|nr:hypothetical protein [Pedobacter agri]